MKLLIIGSTGPTGLQLVEQALSAGHEVTAAVRSPDNAALPSNARKVRADVTDAASLLAAVSGQEVVISSLGSPLSRKPTTLLSDGTRNLIAAMKQSDVRRLICITGIGAGDSRGHGGFFYDKIIQPLLLSEIYKDKDRQELVVRESGLDWTIVRPGQLTNGDKTGNIRVLSNLTGITVGKISRADVAAYILAHLTDAKTFGSIFTLTY